VVFDASALAAYLRDPALEANPGLQYLVGLVDGLVAEHWAAPVAPVPTSVLTVALEVASRAWLNPRGLSSWTRSVDDASRTERLPEQRARAGVYLTDGELAVLKGGSTTRVRMGWLA
jgi:hypothetical protein